MLLSLHVYAANIVVAAAAACCCDVTVMSEELNVNIAIVVDNLFTNATVTTTTTTIQVNRGVGHIYIYVCKVNSASEGRNHLLL